MSILGIFHEEFSRTCEAKDFTTPKTFLSKVDSGGTEKSQIESGNSIIEERTCFVSQDETPGYGNKTKSTKSDPRTDGQFIKKQS